MIEATEDHSFWERADLEEFDAERAYDESLLSEYQEGMSHATNGARG